MIPRAQDIAQRSLIRSVLDGSRNSSSQAITVNGIAAVGLRRVDVLGRTGASLAIEPSTHLPTRVHDRVHMYVSCRRAICDSSYSCPSIPSYPELFSAVYLYARPRRHLAVAMGSRSRRWQLLGGSPVDLHAKKCGAHTTFVVPAVRALSPSAHQLD